MDESLLNAVESTQADERDTLMELIMAAKNEPKDEADTDAESQVMCTVNTYDRCVIINNYFDIPPLLFPYFNFIASQDPDICSNVFYSHLSVP